MKRKGAPKPKTVSYQVIPRSTAIDYPATQMYALLDELVDQHHEDLRKARIALAWCTSWKPDVDGRVVLGKMQKASDLGRELAPFDFVVLLSKRFWMHPETKETQKRALLDHELCHGALAHDAAGEPIENERGQLVFRIRKHDLEEFSAIVQRHGIWKSDIEQFARALKLGEVPEFKPCAECKGTPGWVYVKDLIGNTAVTRCRCFVEWSQQRHAVPA
jgi:hypothetical protein